MLSLTATFGAMVWIFQEGHLSGLLGFTPTGSIDIFTPILMFCIAFGLSMDYEVFLLSRIKEEYDLDRDNEHAVRVGLQKTGRIVTAAALLLTIVFIGIATSEVSIVQLFGVGLSLAVLVDAFLIRATLVPAFMRLAGRQQLVVAVLAAALAPPVRHLGERADRHPGPGVRGHPMIPLLRLRRRPLGPRFGRRTAARACCAALTFGSWEESRGLGMVKLTIPLSTSTIDQRRPARLLACRSTPASSPARARRPSAPPRRLARDQHHSQVGSEHLLHALIGQPEGVVSGVLEGVGVSPKNIQDHVDAALGALPQVYGETAAAPQISPDAYKLLEAADEERRDLGDDYLSTEHLLLAMTKVPGGVGDMLRALGVTTDAVLDALKKVRGSHRVTSENPEEQYQALERYGRDLTEDARRGQARPRHRSGRGDPSRHPGAQPAHEEQPGPHR